MPSEKDALVNPCDIRSNFLRLLSSAIFSAVVAVEFLIL